MSVSCQGECLGGGGCSAVYLGCAVGCVCLSCLSLSVCVCVCICVSVQVCLSVCLSVCQMFICLFIQSVCVCLLSTCLSFFLSVCVCLSAYLSVCISNGCWLCWVGLFHPDSRVDTQCLQSMVFLPWTHLQNWWRCCRSIVLVILSPNRLFG